ncbi:hypothetical protein VTO42DRAFT_778 [Malbranchea cinnamomea]
MGKHAKAGAHAGTKSANAKRRAKKRATLGKSKHNVFKPNAAAARASTLGSAKQKLPDSKQPIPPTATPLAATLKKAKKPRDTTPPTTVNRHDGQPDSDPEPESKHTADTDNLARCICHEPLDPSGVPHDPHRCHLCTFFGRPCRTISPSLLVLADAMRQVTQAAETLRKAVVQMEAAAVTLDWAHCRSMLGAGVLFSSSPSVSPSVDSPIKECMSSNTGSEM